MTLTWWILGACAMAYVIKLAGYLLPRHWLDLPFVPSLAAALTVGLLAALTISNAMAAGQRLALDSRLFGLAAGALALRFKLPYVVVVLAGGVATALGRAAGLP